jgi:hypothetical protein
LWSEGCALLAVEIICCLVDLDLAPSFHELLALPEGLRMQIEAANRG